MALPPPNRSRAASLTDPDDRLARTTAPIACAMHLWIVRHADATPASRAAGDFARKLSPRGRADAERVALWLKRGAHVVDAILTSDAPRASETASILAPGF